jgi:hypothetical protein
MNKAEKITANFSLKELVEAEMPKQAIEWNWAEMTPEQYANIKKIAEVVQEVRNLVNANFKGKGGKQIGIKVTSGLRVLRWELIRNRSGASMHVQGLAADFIPTNCESESQYIQIFDWIMEKYKDWNGGLAAKAYTVKGSKLITTGFIHLDLGTKRRWKY